MNIIIKTPRFIGDTIMMLSAFELIKKEYPNAKYTIVTQEYCVDIFRGKGINEIIIDNTKKNKQIFKLILSIKATRYDLGFIFHNTIKDAFIFKLANVKKTIGYNKEGSKIFLDHWLRIDRTKHYINHYAFLVNSLFDFKYTKLPPIVLNHNESKYVKFNSKNSIGFVLGGSNKGSRQYPEKLTLELLSLLKSYSYSLILLGDNSDSKSNEVYEKYANSIDLDILNISGKTDIAEFIDTIASVNLLITIDSSAMHIASATNTKFITLIGKGTSVFETVMPKVAFGTYLKNDDLCIDENHLIENIPPQEIMDNINKIMNENK